MAKDKLFTPEDFDKEPKFPQKNIVKWIVGSFLGIIIIVAIIFGLKGCDSKLESNPVEEINLVNGIEEDSIADIPQGENVSVKKENVEVVPEVFTNRETENDAPQVITATSEQLAEQSAASVSSDVESEAIKVIRGDYGNCPERKKNLGDKYQLIQNRVNQLKRQGVF